jgi:hypothetical protein
MTKAVTKRRPRKAPEHPADARRSDAGEYIGLVMIGAAVTVAWYLISPATWMHGLIGYVIALAVLVNLYAWQVYGGKHLAGWQKGLARLPLRFAGYGTKGGKPVEAAHGQPAARMMLLVSIAASVVIVAGLSIWLI